MSKRTFAEVSQELMDQVWLLLTVIARPLKPVYVWLIKHELYDAVLTFFCCISLGCLVATILNGLNVWDWLVMIALAMLAALIVYRMRKAGKL